MLVVLGALNGVAFVHAVVPARRQRTWTEQVVSQDPTTFSRALASVTCVAPVVLPEHPETASAAVAQVTQASTLDR